MAVGLSPSLAWLPPFLVGVPLALLTLLYLPACLLAAIAEGDRAAAFDFPRVGRRIGRTLGPYVLAFLLTVAAGILARFGLVLLCIGIFPSRFLARCVAVHAFASTYREGEASVAPVPQV